MFPDFVACRIVNGAKQEIHILETKGQYLASGGDTAYKRTLMDICEQVFASEQVKTVHDVRVASGEIERVLCAVIEEEHWENQVARRFAAKVS